MTAAGLLLAAAPRAAAQQPAPAAGDVAARSTLTAERVRVRAELDKVNAEIDRLKSAERGVRDDYRLRARLADAEALARRLTDIDTRLGTPAAAPVKPPVLAAEPTVATTDGPAEIEAKADILADQARRVGVQAEALRQRVGQLKARRDLRRRVGQMDRDPFAPLEGSKRRVVAAAPAASAPRAPTAQESGGPRASSPPPSGNATGGGTTDVAGGGGPALTPGAPGPVTSSGGGQVVTPTVSAPAPTGATTTTPDGAGSISVQLRDLLDPATLAEIRRLESSGTAGAGLDAMEHAAAALKLRAERLAAQSSALRARARH